MVFPTLAAIWAVPLTNLPIRHGGTYFLTSFTHPGRSRLQVLVRIPRLSHDE